jgi:acetyl-CoA/propionyl-CoA carboxylase biotin carboxyl carrier protein
MRELTLTSATRRSFGRVLIANRAEIAVRVARACRDGGFVSVAVYADPDRDAPHVRMADIAWPLGGSTPGDSYLAIGKIIDAARRTAADAVHPGYGFLSENADFAEAVIDAGLVWIGPPPQAIRELGDKVTARRVAAKVGAPLVVGSDGPVTGPAEVIAFADAHGLPVAIKAAFGGGGRGLKVARSTDEIPELFASAVREAVSAFGRGECFVERYLDNPRHVEVQVLADQHGRVVVVGTRDCSLQRRFQKLVEEAPAPFLSGEQIELIRSSAKAICRAANYESAGTVEYLVGADGTVSFLEVNTRLQVEHPVTEATTGLDLVREQFRIAAGEPLSCPDDPPAIGHAFEFRINGEDPGRGFTPAPGRITRYREPSGPGVRVDSGVEEGTVVGSGFDSMLAKLVVHGATRTEALSRARRALSEMVVDGLPTVLPFHRAVVDDPAFTAEPFAVHTRWIESGFENRIAPYDALGRDEVQVQVGARAMRVRLPGLASLGPGGDAIREQEYAQRAGAAALGNTVAAPMHGTVTNVAVSEGDEVEAGAVIAVVEAMKMENAVLAHRAGTVTDLSVSIGQVIAQDTTLCQLL